MGDRRDRHRRGDRAESEGKEIQKKEATSGQRKRTLWWTWEGRRWPRKRRWPRQRPKMKGRRIPKRKRTRPCYNI
uniref:Uncharacterized protein n=1 Tax=Amphimedon queenslandica TaxID=400682 RepID=A0A1X7T581_AMPQE